MSLFSDVLARLARDPAKDYLHRRVGPDGGAVAADEDYLRIWLRSAHLADVRRWARRFHPVIHARFVHVDPTSGVRETMAVVSPSRTFEELDPAHLDRFIVVNQSLFGPIPYRGEIASEVALFSVEAENLAKPYLDLLGELSASAAGSLSGVGPLIAPLKRGAEVLLLDPQKAELEIGLARTDTALKAGTIVVARVDRAAGELADVTVDPHDFQLLDAQGRPVRGFPYMVLGVERVANRADARSLPEIRDGWARVRNAAQEGRTSDEVLAEFRTLIRVVNFSPDLVPRDRIRLVGEFAAELRRAGIPVEDVPGLPPAHGGGPELGGAGPQEFGGASELAVAAPPAPELDAVLQAFDPAVGRVSMSEAQRMILDPDVPEAVVRQLLVPNPGRSRPFAPALAFNPNVVAAPGAELEVEGVQLMTWANDLCMWRRQNAFLRRVAGNDPRPVLVSVGDSWFQFPVFLDDVVDQLGAAYSVWSLDAAGDTLANIVITERRHLVGLHRWGDRAKALLVSGSGNDIVGEDPDGVSVLAKILKPFTPGKPAAWYVDTPEFARRLGAVRDTYDRLMLEVASEFPGVPVICHGYDRAIPSYPGDPRQPIWAAQDAWLTSPMVGRLGIRDATLRRDIIAALIDRLNETLRELCGGGGSSGRHAHAFHVDVRGVVGTRWADELHPTDDGFADVGRAFRTVLDAALGGAPVLVAGAAPMELVAAGGDETAPPAVIEGAIERVDILVEALEGARAAAEPSAAAAARPLPPISERAHNLIVDYETGGRAFYERVLKKRPVWPEGKSGITIGFGYDLGYVEDDAFSRDWAALPEADRQRLAPLVGRHAGRDSPAEMRDLLRGVRDIAVEWDTAEAVFRTATRPKFVRATVAALDNTHLLPPDAFGALVSLSFNRGAAYRKARDPKDALDRYREMRGIGAAMTAKRFSDIPGLFRLMKRVWRGTSVDAGLSRRREDEAKLFEDGLAQMVSAGEAVA
jgi:hypothetical protein